MGMYSLVADVQRTVLEKYVCELEANSVEEALDLVYDHFSDDFPNSQLDLKVRRKAQEETVSSNVIYIEHEYMNRSANDERSEDSLDDGPEVA